ncbi:hypothetical protein ACFWVC_11560 [Streptomyces sp. NPDC058691]|uniref:hypothetical protein n=1 Tax=Streptomyces sp. NPDC058691 TaxID=3346601 RepID=UPI00364B19DC
MNADLSPVIAATAQWLLRSYPPHTGGAWAASLAQTQARQAVTVAAWLRYPTGTDAAWVTLAGPGGSGRLDWLVGADAPGRESADRAWRTWVDEVVASWAACLLIAPAVAEHAVAAVAGCEHAAGLVFDFRRLTSPDDHDQQATALLRHPDLLTPLAALHEVALRQRLELGQRDAA